MYAYKTTWSIVCRCRTSVCDLFIAAHQYLTTNNQYPRKIRKCLGKCIDSNSNTIHHLIQKSRACVLMHTYVLSLFGMCMIHLIFALVIV